VSPPLQRKAGRAGVILGGREPYICESRWLLMTPGPVSSAQISRSSSCCALLVGRGAGCYGLSSPAAALFPQEAVPRFLHWRRGDAAAETAAGPGRLFVWQSCSFDGLAPEINCSGNEGFKGYCLHASGFRFGQLSTPGRYQSHLIAYRHPR